MSKHAAVAVAALFMVLAAPASAAPTPAWTQKADEIAAPWPGLQEASGSFRDYVLVRDPSDQRDDYGDAILGYGLLLNATRRNDPALADAGLRALEYSLERAARSPSTQVFHQLATVSAYNLARQRYADHPVFQRARSRWEDVLRRIEVYRIGRQKVTNKSIVEAILLLELVRSGLTSTQPGAALADPAATLALVKHFLASDLPEAARPFQIDGRTVLGDMPLLPPAYHGLSIGMLARTIELLGDEAPSAARTLLRRGVAASLAMAGPDGEVAYHGRSQAQAWTLTLTAYGAERSAQHGLAERTVGRLIDAYPTGPEGFLVTPSMAQGIDAAIPGVDEYVAAASYSGLTLMALEWAIAAGGGDAGGAQPSGAHVLGTGTGAWATSRRGDVWFAVKRTRTSPRDLRYDFGLMALKVRGGGTWGDAMPLRPRTVSGVDSVGPVLTAGGSVGYPEGTELRLGRAGAIVVRGGFRTRTGRWLRRGVTFTFAPVACGVRLTFAARAGDRFAYSGFFLDTPRRSGRTVRDGDQQLRFDTAPSVGVRAGYASGSDVGLTRAVARWKRTRAGTASIETCAR
ncbi:MAG TPA: hypothetical protein VF517_14545 [Thermoleophilaceae bacterium]